MIRVFVGTGANGEDAESCAVLEYTIRRHCLQPVEIVWMMLSRDPASFWSGWDTSSWATPFSGFRWGIPEFCGFQGRAIYMDSDMIVQDDLARLWEAPLEPGKAILSKGNWRFCVTLFDCAAVKPAMLPLQRLKAKDGHRAQALHLRERKDIIQAFDPNWNYCDLEDHGPIKAARIVHYTDMSCQPHLGLACERLGQQGWHHWYDGPIRPHPRPEIVKLFETEYRQALEAGYRVESYVPPVRYGDYRKASLKNYQRGFR